jgi:nitric oxide synthase oxygenase domain/subunit
MEEMALRKEIEEKKRREGKLAEPKMTQKQKELLEAQLEKEKVVRNRVAKIKHEVDQVGSLGQGQHNIVHGQTSAKRTEPRQWTNLS